MKKDENSADIDEARQDGDGVEVELHDFEEKQTSVTQTLQMIVYPALVAFIILAAYGFYLVQRLTTDMHELTKVIAQSMTTVSNNMDAVSSNMDTISGTMNVISGQMTDLVSSTTQMTTSTKDMAGNLHQMNSSTQNMAVSTYNMQRDMWRMNKNISGPMKMFNKFNPFGSDETAPYVVPPPYYGSTYYQWPYATQQVQQPAATQQVVAPQVAQPAAVAAEPAAGEQVPAASQPGQSAEPESSTQPTFDNGQSELAGELTSAHLGSDKASTAEESKPSFLQKILASFK